MEAMNHRPTSVTCIHKWGKGSWRGAGRAAGRAAGGACNILVLPRCTAAPKSGWALGCRLTTLPSSSAIVAPLVTLSAAAPAGMPPPPAPPPLLARLSRLAGHRRIAALRLRRESGERGRSSGARCGLGSSGRRSARLGWPAGRETQAQQFDLPCWEAAPGFALPPPPPARVAAAAAGGSCLQVWPTHPPARFLLLCHAVGLQGWKTYEADELYRLRLREQAGLTNKDKCAGARARSWRTAAAAGARAAPAQIRPFSRLQRAAHDFPHILLGCALTPAASSGRAGVLPPDEPRQRRQLAGHGGQVATGTPLCRPG